MQYPMNAFLKYFTLILPISLFLVGCNTQPTSGSQTNEDTTSMAASEPAGNTSGTLTCYKYVSGKDSVRIQLTTAGTQVKGQLVYSLFEKDKNTGTFEGQMSGDTLFAEYTFQSEGSTSVREIALLKRENTLVEGYGEVKEENGKMVFTNKNALTFSGNMVLQETPCQ
jgi:hypothetical protein